MIRIGFIAVIILLALGACGRKGDLEPPASAQMATPVHDSHAA